MGRTPCQSPRERTQGIHSRACTERTHLDCGGDQRLRAGAHRIRPRSVKIRTWWGYSYAVELDLGRQTSLASAVPRTEPPRAASALKRSAAVAGVALAAGVRAPSRNDAATDPPSSGACWSAGRGKQLRALAESPGASPLQAGHRIPATTAFACNQRRRPVCRRRARRSCIRPGARAAARRRPIRGVQVRRIA